MAYCDLNDLEKALPRQDLIRLTDDAGAGVVDEDVVGWAIDTAAQVMDGYLSQAAPLPLAGHPIVPLSKINQDLAVCNLYARPGTDMPTVWRERCQRAHDLLEAIAAGRVALYPGPTEASETEVRAAARGPEFDEDRLKNY
jgi:phage gp36-like protein